MTCWFCLDFLCVYQNTRTSSAHYYRVGLLLFVARARSSAHTFSVSWVHKHNKSFAFILCRRNLGNIVAAPTSPLFAIEIYSISQSRIRKMYNTFPMFLEADMAAWSAQKLSLGQRANRLTPSAMKKSTARLPAKQLEQCKCWTLVKLVLWLPLIVSSVDFLFISCKPVGSCRTSTHLCYWYSEHQLSSWTFSLLLWLALLGAVACRNSLYWRCEQTKSRRPMYS